MLGRDFNWPILVYSLANKTAYTISIEDNDKSDSYQVREIGHCVNDTEPIPFTWTTPL